MERFGNFLALQWRAYPLRLEHALEIILSIVAVLVALEGVADADKLYGASRRSSTVRRGFADRLQLLANKYYVDELYGAVVVKPLLGFSKFVLEWVVDFVILGGAAWCSRYCHFYRSDSATLAIGQSALLCGVAGRGRCGGFCFSCWFRGQRCWPVFRQFTWHGGH